MFPAAPTAPPEELDPAPPPDPPVAAAAQPTLQADPPPPPCAVIVEKIELLPDPPTLGVEGPGPDVPPPPTVIGKAEAVTVIPAGAFKGLAGEPEKPGLVGGLEKTLNPPAPPHKRHKKCRDL